MAFGLPRDPARRGGARPNYPTAALPRGDPGHSGRLFAVFSALSVAMVAMGSPGVAMLGMAFATSWTWVKDLAEGAPREVEARRLPAVVPLDTRAYVFGPKKDALAVTRAPELDLMGW